MHGIPQVMLAKVKAWIIALSAALLSIGLAVLYGLRKGKNWQKGVDDAREAQANVQAAQQARKAQESRNETDQRVAATPDKGPQRVGDADPDTAAGHLRDDGWMRP